MADDTAQIETLMDEIRDQIKVLKKAREEHLADNSKKSKDALQARGGELVKKMAEATGAIDAYEKRVKLDRKMKPDERTSRMGKAKTFREELVNIGKEILSSKEQHDTALVAAVEARVKTRFGAGENGNGMSDKEAKKMAQELVRTRREDQLFLLARAELEAALETHRDVCEIEQNIRELKDLMDHLVQMIHQQSEDINRSVNAQAKANEEVRKQNEYLEKAEKGFCSIQ